MKTIKDITFKLKMTVIEVFVLLYFLNKGQNLEQNGDGIIVNLSTLKFDAGIVEPMARELLFLRRRSQLLTANIVAHAVFTVSILNEVKRQACYDERLSTTNKTNRNHTTDKRQRLVLYVSVHNSCHYYTVVCYLLSICKKNRYLSRL